MVAVAELEAGLTGERTRAALAQAKHRGVKLGNPRLAEVVALESIVVRRRIVALNKQIVDLSSRLNQL
jgi:DNA invertase Pin-like site-specific DNA recombinase